MRVYEQNVKNKTTGEWYEVKTKDPHRNMCKHLISPLKCIQTPYFNEYSMDGNHFVRASFFVNLVFLPFNGQIS